MVISQNIESVFRRRDIKHLRIICHRLTLLLILPLAPNPLHFQTFLQLQILHLMSLDLNPKLLVLVLGTVESILLVFDLVWVIPVQLIVGWILADLALYLVEFSRFLLRLRM